MKQKQSFSLVSDIDAEQFLIFLSFMNRFSEAAIRRFFKIGALKNFTIF